jgi:hypothetical protein
VAGGCFALLVATTRSAPLVEFRSARSGRVTQGRILLPRVCWAAFLSVGGGVVFQEVSGGWDFPSAYHKMGGIVEFQRLTEKSVFGGPQSRKM